MNPKLAVISLWAENVPNTARFYQEVIGLRLISHHAGRPHFDLEGIFLVILEGKPVSPQNAVPSRFPLIAFSVDDLDTAVKGLQEHHIVLPWGVEKDLNSRWVMFYDPAGNLIELVQFEK